MLKFVPRLMLVAGIGITGAACQDDGNAPPRGYYQPAPPGYYNPPPNYNYYGNQPRNAGWGYQGDGTRYTTVTVTNRGQNGNRDDVVQQRVACGSQYFDGYRTRNAPTC